MKAKQIQAQIGQLIQLSNLFQKEGNFEYALPCYRKILQLLQAELLSSSDYSSQYALKQNIALYEQMLRKAQQKSAQANKKQATLKKQQKIQQKKPIRPPQKKEEPLIKQQKAENKSTSVKKNASSDRQINKNVDKNASNKQVPNNKPIANKQPNYKQPINKPPVNQSIKGKPVPPPKKKPIDPDIEEMIVKDIKLSFKDIVGMKQAKSAVQEAVIRPRLKPDFYVGIRAPPKGILFYGPPGNGKTYIAKALANQCKCTFFAVSAATIMGKWVGDSEKKLRLLFETALSQKPSIIFIDEIDSLLTARSQKQNEASRRVKTQFLVHMDGIVSAKQGDILLIGATNLPSQLDKAVLSRFNQLIYIGMPDPQVRQGIILQNLQSVQYNLSQGDLKTLNQMLQGYSARQIKNICKQVSMIPLRQLSMSVFKKATKQTIREVDLNDFEKILSKKKRLLSNQDLKKYAGKFGED